MFASLSRLEMNGIGHRSFHGQVAFPVAFHGAATIALDWREDTGHQIDKTSWNTVHGAVAQGTAF